MSPASPPLRCPACGAGYGGEERFCPACGVPLVLTEETDERDLLQRRYAQRIKPQLSQGELVRAARARNLAEAEFIQGLLLEEGVPSLLKRSAGFDVPDFLAAGPRDVLVPEAGLETAREVLLEAEIIHSPAGRTPVVRPVRLLIGLLGALVLGALLVWGLLALL